jgi:hypothetical protein
MSGFFDTLSKRDGETDKKRFIIGGTVAVAFLHNNPGLHITTHTYLSGFVTFISTNQVSPFNITK